MLLVSRSGPALSFVSCTDCSKLVATNIKACRFACLDNTGGIICATIFYFCVHNDFGLILPKMLNLIYLPTYLCTFLVDVQISDGYEATPTAGESYSLNCSTSGAKGFTFQWRRRTSIVEPSSPSAMLSFSPLRLSDAGQYTCEATLGSRIFTDNFDVIAQS